VAKAGNSHTPPDAAYRTGGSIGIPGGKDRVTVGDAARIGAAEGRPVTFGSKGSYWKNGRDMDKSAAA